MMNVSTFETSFKFFNCTVAVRRFNFIVKRCRHTLQLKNLNLNLSRKSKHPKALESLSENSKKLNWIFDWIYIIIIIFKKKKTPKSKKDGVNLGKRERREIRRLVKILEGWLKEEKEKEAISNSSSTQTQAQTQAGEKEKKPEEEKDDKEDAEILDESSSSSESSLESDTDSDAPAAAQPPTFVSTF